MKVVHDGKGFLTDVNTAGDEPYLMGMILKNVPIVVSENRKVGIQELIDNSSVNIVILDDAFQNRIVERDLDIITISAHDQKNVYQLIPWGKLREPFQNIKRAECVIYTKTMQYNNIPIHKKLIPYLNNSPIASIMEPILMKIDKTGYHKAFPTNEPVFVFCGIGNPDSFIQTVKEVGLTIGGKRIFKDHQIYDATIIQDLYAQVKSGHFNSTVTTEKDMVKIPESFRIFFKFYVIKINLMLKDDTEIMDLIKPVLLPSR